MSTPGTLKCRALPLRRRPPRRSRGPDPGPSSTVPRTTTPRQRSRPHFAQPRRYPFDRRLGRRYATTILVSIYGDTGNQMFYVGRTSANAATLGVSINGSTAVTTTGTTTMPAGTKLVRITRLASTGTITFWTASSDAARSLPTTDPAWKVLENPHPRGRRGALGTLELRRIPLRIGHPIRRGGLVQRNPPLRNLRNGMNNAIAAERDYLSPTLQTNTDTAGNIWQLHRRISAVGCHPHGARRAGNHFVRSALEEAGEDLFNTLSTGGRPINSYDVSCKSRSGGKLRWASGRASPIRVKKLTPSKKYRCRVRARNAVGTGRWSALGKKFSY